MENPTDRQLLEHAAKAAGIRWQDWTPMVPSEFYPAWWPYDWNPLRDDGDAARLEAALWLSVEWSSDYVMVGDCSETFDRKTGDRQAARRRAGVRAAAEIGRAMP
jgi:hypothetical protein